MQQERLVVSPPPAPPPPHILFPPVPRRIMHPLHHLMPTGTRNSNNNNHMNFLLPPFLLLLHNSNTTIHMPGTTTTPTPWLLHTTPTKHTTLLRGQPTSLKLPPPRARSSNKTITTTKCSSWLDPYRLPSIRIRIPQQKTTTHPSHLLSKHHMF